VVERLWTCHQRSPEAESDQELPREELEQRVIFSLLRPVVASATLFGVTSKTLGGWLQLAHLRHLRDQGLTLKEASAHLDVSERTAKRLFRQLKVNFLRPETEHNLSVTLEFMLRATPMSEARLNQVLRHIPAEAISAALKQMLDEERIAPNAGRTVTYRVVRSVTSMVRDTWLARIGGLNSLLQNLTDTVYGSFVLRDPRSTARTLTFSVMPERLDELQAAFLALVQTIAALDEEAEGHPDAVPMRLSVFFAPFGLADVERSEPDPSDNPSEPG
ncbi:MAG: hypothetical protein AAFX99_34810, partial [Myxococcota bacterium]